MGPTAVVGTERIAGFVEFEVVGLVGDLVEVVVLVVGPDIGHQLEDKKAEIEFEDLVIELKTCNKMSAEVVMEGAVGERQTAVA